VEAGPHLEPEGLYAVADRGRALDTPRRAVEGGQEAVTERLDLAAKALDLPAGSRSRNAGMPGIFQ
jgi:hypothetical protein